jgi:hypothetical protein
MQAQTDLGTWVGSEQSQDALKASGYFTGAVWDVKTGKWVKPEKKNGPDITLPGDAAKADPNAMSSYDITQMQLDYQKMTLVTIPNQNIELKKLKDQYGLFEDRGSTAAKEVKSKIVELGLEIAKNISQTEEWTAKLGKAGATVNATTGLTYNQQFAASIQAGGVGPDVAGFSDLANMSADQLAEIAKGGLGKSQAYAEKAQTYLSMMKSGKTGTEAASAKPTAKAEPGSPAQTQAIGKEYDTQLKALQSLTDGTVKEYGKQTDAFTAFLDSLASLRATQYPILEKQDLIHYATSEEIARTAAQKEIDFMEACVNYGGRNPIIQNYIVWDKKGPDWTPPVFQGAPTTRLTSADFTQVGANVQSIAAGGLGRGTSADVQVVQNITNNIGTDVDPAAAAKVTNAQTKATNKALAGVAYLGGSMV